MNDKQRYVVQDVLAKLIGDAMKDAKADMKAELIDALEQECVGSFKVKIGSMTAEIKLHEGRREVTGDGPDFTRFMAEHGLVTPQVDPDWREYVFATEGGEVVFRETGEVVPGAYVKHTASYPQVYGIKAKDRMKLIDEARQAGLIGDVPALLGGGDID